MMGLLNKKCYKKTCLIYSKYTQKLDFWRNSNCISWEVKSYFWNNGVCKRSDAESGWTIMHNWFAIVLRSISQRINSTFKVAFKLFLPDIFIFDFNKIISIRTGLLMKKTNGVDELMDNDSFKKTTNTSYGTLKWNGLLAANFSQVRVTTYILCYPNIICLIWSWTATKTCTFLK